MDERTDGRMDGRTENLPILKDFVPYQGRCPASPMKTKEKEEQGKGTADHLMPLGYLLSLKSFFREERVKKLQFWKVLQEKIAKNPEKNSVYLLIWA